MTEEVIYLPPFPLPAKPKYGSPCNGCGACCHLSVCKVGQLAFDVPAEAAPCPGMVYKDGRVFCEVVLAEKATGRKPLIEKALGIGWGCDSQLESELYESD